MRLSMLAALAASLAVVLGQDSVNETNTYQIFAGTATIRIKKGSYSVQLAGGPGGSTSLKDNSIFPGGTGVVLSIPVVIRSDTTWHVVAGKEGDRSLDDDASGAGGGGGTFVFDKQGTLLYIVAGGGGAGAEVAGQDGLQNVTSCKGQGGKGGPIGTNVDGRSTVPFKVPGPGGGGAGALSAGQKGTGPDAGYGGQSRAGFFAGGGGYQGLHGGIGGGGGPGKSGGGGGGGYCGGNGGNSGDGPNNSGGGGTSIVTAAGLALLDASKHQGPSYSSGQAGNRGSGYFFIAGSKVI